MISKLLKAVAVAALALSASVASALPLLSGNLNFVGSATFDWDTQINSVIFNDAEVSFGTDDFAGVAKDTVVNFYSPWNVLTTATPFVLWEVDGFTFTLTQVTLNLVTDTLIGDYLQLQGRGYVSKDGFGDTGGVFSLSSQTINGQGSQFSFSATSAVPEPGTMALLGAGLIGLGMVRRRAK